MKPISYKRVLAYLIDIFIVFLFGILLTYFIPVSDEYLEKSEELTEVVDNYVEGEISDSEYLEKVNDITYVINRESVVASIISLAISIIYFVVFAYYCNGQTLGKKVMNLQIISENYEKASFWQLFIRSALIDSLLMNAISIIIILTLSKNLYLQVNDTLTTLFGCLYIVIFVMILFRQDARGLHDMLAKTKVITLDKKENNQIEVIKEKIEEETNSETIETLDKDNNSKKEVTNKKSKTIKPTTKSK